MLIFSNNIGQEALYSLKYQNPPNLATELTTVFERVIQKKKELSREHSGSKLVRLTNEYFYKEESKKMLDIIEKYTGLKLGCVIFKQPFINFAILFHFGEYDDPAATFPTTEAIAERYTGKLANEVYKSYEKRFGKQVKTQEELIALSKSIMNDKAAIRAGMFEKHGLRGKLYFCPYLAFNCKEFFGPDVRELTAKEIAAIICHECGHAITFIVHACDLCYKKEILYRGAKQAFMNFNDETKYRIAMNAIKKLFPDKYEKFHERVNELKAKQKTFSAGGAVGYSIVAAIYLIFNIINNCCYLVFRSIFEAFRLAFGGMIEHAMSYDNHGKRSDFSHGCKAGGYYEEELADEYVSKMGYTQYLTSGLDAIEKAVRFYGTPGYMTGSKVDYFFRLLPWLASSLFQGYREDFIHPDEYKRQENAIMDIIKAFKEKNMDPKLLDEYYQAFLAVKKLNETNTFEKNWERANHAIATFIEYIISAPYEMLVNSRFHEEYDRLFNQAQMLMHNKIYALAYGLKNRGK